MSKGKHQFILVCIFIYIIQFVVYDLEVFQPYVGYRVALMLSP